MKRERSSSSRSLPCLNSNSSIDVCRSHQGYMIVHKRLRGRNASSLSKSGVVCSTNGPTKNRSSNYIKSMPVMPTSATASLPSALTQPADFFVDPSDVSSSEVISLAEEMAADFYSELSIMYDMLSDIKTSTTESQAVDELMHRLRTVLSSDANGHTVGENPSTRVKNVRGLYHGLIRVFIFLYQRYHRTFEVLEVSELLAASWQRLLAFVVEYHVLDEVFVRKVYDYVVQIVGSSS